MSNLTDNYPDDWRTWSKTDPRSPLYEEPSYVCVECERAFEEIEMANDEMCKECWIKEDEE